MVRSPSVKRSWRLRTGQHQMAVARRCRRRTTPLAWASTRAHVVVMASVGSDRSGHCRARRADPGGRRSWRRRQVHALPTARTMSPSSRTTRSTAERESLSRPDALVDDAAQRRRHTAVGSASTGWSPAARSYELEPVTDLARGGGVGRSDELPRVMTDGMRPSRRPRPGPGDRPLDRRRARRGDPPQDGSTPSRPAVSPASAWPPDARRHSAWHRPR